ncbi:hypothetical protein [Streptomyces cinnamoneus]|uniref:hypothetical protein n=1 Tax=Streptomyces cinnamoneus TaxID=53446 RepID=UPI0037B3604C
MNDSPGRTPGGERARADSGGGQHDRRGGGPGGGWGGPWNGGHGPHAAPRAPQPGVIPLRPLAVGEIIEGSVSTLRRHWRTALGVSLAVAVGTQAVATVVERFRPRGSSALTTPEELADATPREVLHALGESLTEIATTSVIGLIGSIVASAMLTVVVSRAVLGRPVTARDAWANARPRLPAMAGLFCVIPLLIVGAFAVGTAPGLVLVAAGAEQAGLSLTLLGGMAGLVGSVWLWIRYSLAAPALMLERQGVMASLRRSEKLVRGSWGRIFGIQILAGLLVFLVATIVALPTSPIEFMITGEAGSDDPSSWTNLIFTGVAATISSMIALPITSGMTALLYMDQRIRRESLDIELTRAASMGEGQ